MSDQVTVARVLSFQARVQHLLQQNASKFRKAVREGTHVGKQVSVVDQVGAVELLEKQGRHADLQTVAVPIARRWVTPTPYAVAEFVDRTDQLRMLWDPKGEYAKAFAKGAGRKIDSVIIAAFNAAAMIGESGAQTETFDTSLFQIVHGSLPLTIAKLRLIREKFRNAEVELEDEELWMAIAPQQENNLLAETQVVSEEYNRQRDGVPVLKDGRLQSFLGFNFIVTTRLPKVSTTRSCFAWVKSGMYLGIWDEVRTPMDWIPRKQAWQIACTADFGATRLEQGRVIECQCTES